MKLLLDTCALIWCVSDPDKLSPAAQAAVCSDDVHVCISAISYAEIACLVESGKIETAPHWRTWFDRALDDNGWSVLALDLDTVQEAFSLPGSFHRDPADRFLVATSRLNRIPIVTADRRLLDYPHVQTLW